MMDLAELLPAWPEWAMNLLLIMGVLLFFTWAFTQFIFPDDTSASEEGANDTVQVVDAKAQQNKEFLAFRRQYILVYLIIMLADWMQGTHMYTLYLSYNVNISALFLTGFLSGAVFAPFLGSAVDKYGRKRSCIVYCVLEIIINTMEHSTNFTILLTGRVLGGISTNLLFSAFESWMTTEHRKRQFPEAWLSRTYSAASVGNGSMAIIAGIVAQVMEDFLGQIGPFQGAIGLTVAALLLVLQWEENYGEESDEKKEESSSSGLYQQFVDGWSTTFKDSRVWRIGMTQALSEGGMYTFVFMWVPTLLSLDPPGGVPTGCVFSSLMMAITIGGFLFPPLQSIVSKLFTCTFAPELSATLIYTLAGASMAVPAICLSSDSSSCFTRIIVSFIVVEACVGLFMPVAGTLRSKYVPDALQGAILNIFRLPLNAVVVLGTHATDVMESWKVFSLVSACFLGAALLQFSMMLFGTSAHITTTTRSKQD